MVNNPPYVIKGLLYTEVNLGKSRWLVFEGILRGQLLFLYQTLEVVIPRHENIILSILKIDNMPLTGFVFVDHEWIHYIMTVMWSQLCIHWEMVDSFGITISIPGIQLKYEVPSHTDCIFQEQHGVWWIYAKSLDSSGATSSWWWVFQAQ